MSVRFGDPVAIRAYQHSPSIEPSSPGLTNADTIEDGYDSRREPDENDMLKYRMLLTFAETDIHQLKEALAKECERANAEKLRADKAEKVSSQVTDKLHEAFEKSKADEASRNEARKDAKQAKLEANHLREKLDDAQTALRKLEDDLKEASKPQVHTDQAMINHLHSTISTRDSNIERLREKNDELMAENFTALAQIKQDSGEIQSLSEKNSVQAAKITNLSSKLAIVEGDYDKYVHFLPPSPSL
jgi:chromosome segregation ATPase